LSAGGDWCRNDIFRLGRAMNRAAKESFKRLLSKIFVAAQRLGVDILPRHFYSEIPDIRKLKATTAWREAFTMKGVAGTAPQSQIKHIADLFDDGMRSELRDRHVHAIACERNGTEGFGPVEADVLHAFIRRLRPRKIIQVGCGVSTAICLDAAQMAGYPAEIICVEPYPNGFLKSQAELGNIILIGQPVENLASSFVEALDDGDLFFVDSSHTLGPAGEVSRIILELLPNLKSGVFVHFHDICFPYDYHGGILDNPQFFPHESVLLHAFLAYNQLFEIVFSLSMLHHKAQAELKTILPNYRPARHEGGLLKVPGDFPSSTYLRRIGPLVAD
jgi:hypothetical protein